MACGACCEILGIGHADDAAFSIMGGGSEECPTCCCDYCEMHYKAIKVGSSKWLDGCPHCIEDDDVYATWETEMTLDEFEEYMGNQKWIKDEFKRTSENGLKEQLEAYRLDGTIPNYK